MTEVTYELLQAKNEEIEKYRSGISQFVSWLREKRPSMSGHGAPILILENLLTGEPFDMYEREAKKWKELYEAADKYIKESPCDPDIHLDQIIAHGNLQHLKKQHGLI